ncbi:type I secretion system permease/ATPase [Methylobacterium sp. E-016]|uniref:type I secretion system permease/ATPase n=1 Tax=Methylobacterium sp. E-016 TaxID=2836556 RepID=UPI001FB9A075|nr:type I secretion system permease/ATPase [Methylobacterium sp. E-016]MCJ2075429.1 type I secretion system permease/ATPase [Methylobacterium sp. E-016]
MATSPASSELFAALSRCRSAFVGVAVISGLVNLLYLTGSFFMLEVYDRVIPSRSIPTLIGLGGLALILYVFQGLIEILRSRILTRVGATLDESLSERVFDIVVRGSLKQTASSDGLLPLRDLDQVRAFLSGIGPSAFFDLPWMPIYLLICFMFHPLIGVAALTSAGILALVGFVTDRATRGPAKMSTNHGVRRNGLAEASRRNAEVLIVMGMQRWMTERWSHANRDYMQAQQRVSDIASGLGTLSKVFRMALQSAVLALGAYLVINGQASSGVIIASSILVARALAPAELAIASWKGFVQASQSWGRLSDLLEHLPVAAEHHPLPSPIRSLQVESLSVAPPGVYRLVVQDATFSLQAGQVLGVIGPSASGKSCLVRGLVGIWPAARGTVRLDGAAIDQWSTGDLGPHIGFLPQEVELFAGSIAENIARFDPTASADDVLAAAQAAGVHELILRLPEGYDTRIGERGAGLSAGQRQRVGLARALYGTPFLVILDEPNANLDAEGEGALTRAILSIRQRKGICIVIAHRPSALAAVDLILTMADGRIQTFGPKDEVLKRVLRPAAMPVEPQRRVPVQPLREIA